MSEEFRPNYRLLFPNSIFGLPALAKNWHREALAMILPENE